MMQRQDYQIGSPPTSGFHLQNFKNVNYHSANQRDQFTPVYTPATKPQTQPIKFNDSAAPFEFVQQKNTLDLDKNFPSFDSMYTTFNLNNTTVKPFQPTSTLNENNGLT